MCASKVCINEFHTRLNGGLYCVPYILSFACIEHFTRLRFNCNLHFSSLSKNMRLKVCAAEVCVAKVCVSEICTAEVCADKVCASDVRVSKVRTPEVCAPKICVPEVRTLEVCAAKVRTPEVCAPKICISKFHTRLNRVFYCIPYTFSFACIEHFACLGFDCNLHFFIHLCNLETLTPIKTSVITVTTTKSTNGIHNGESTHHQLQ